MEICKDCIHCECCFMQYGEELSEKWRGENGCKNFKDRSRFVELPCKVGDILYFNNQHIKYARVIAIYIDASGGMFDLDVTTNEETVAGYKHFINKDYTFDDIGKRIFLTKEEAEQALKEREN